MRALLSVYDKTGILELAQGLHDLGWDLVSSGGTARKIREAGIPVMDTEEVTGFPAILGHRVMTLHPKIHGGLLAIPDDPEHQQNMADYGIEMFDLMVGNLYPFGADPSAFAHGGGTAEDVIDIGGPAMVRAAAKNHAYLGVVTNPSQYAEVVRELRDNNNQLSAETRRRLSREAFAHTAAYDAAVVNHFDEGEQFPASIHLTLKRSGPELQYGENPHQGAALYKLDGATPWWDAIRNFSDEDARKPGYLNIFDGDAGQQITNDLVNLYPDKPNCVIIKHANPCGLAVADTQEEAYRLALSCDPKSAFGGIVVFNQPLGLATAQLMASKDNPQADVIIAPNYAEGAALALRKRRKQTRILMAPAPKPATRMFRQVDGGFLVQEPFTFKVGREDMTVVTNRQPTESEWQDALLAHRLSYWGTSNTIALVKDGVLWGLGVGQQNRVDSGRIATQKTNGRASGGACASDAFYPFADGIEEAYVAGVAVIIQPGGSVKDDECIAKANELDIAMIFTGERHFKH